MLNDCLVYMFVFSKVVRLDFGMNEENPVERLHVYSKHNPNIARRFPKEEVCNKIPIYCTLRMYSFQCTIQDADSDLESKEYGGPSTFLKPVSL